MMMLCTHCNEPMEMVDDVTLHTECRIRLVMGSAAHQLGECTCCGGTRADPPGVSRREAARLAYETHLALHPDWGVRK